MQEWAGPANELKKLSMEATPVASNQVAPSEMSAEA
jgi:hypothetical protein